MRNPSGNPLPSEILHQLNQLEDFRKAFEINSELAGMFKEAVFREILDQEGLNPSDWAGFARFREGH